MLRLLHPLQHPLDVLHQALLPLPPALLAVCGRQHRRTAAPPLVRIDMQCISARRPPAIFIAIVRRKAILIILVLIKVLPQHHPPHRSPPPPLMRGPLYYTRRLLRRVLHPSPSASSVLTRCRHAGLGQPLSVGSVGGT